MNSIWLEHPKYPGYGVSPEGNVMSFKQGRNKIRTPRPSRGGYVCTELSTDNGNKTVNIHRIVADIYIKPIRGKKFVNHKNGIKTDNRVENLEWCTHSENILHSRRVLRKSIGEKNGNAKLTEPNVVKILLFLKIGKLKHREIAAMFGVDRTTVTAINSKNYWYCVKEKRGN